LDKAALAAHVRDFPDALLKERAAHFGVHINAIWVALKSKRCSAALRLQVDADGFQHQSISSSIWAWGQPLTRRVSRSVK
jgi:hypothetical protein